MATPSDQQLIQYIQQGRRDGLAQLFDRYSSDLYDFLARVVGDRDQAARLLEEAFMRVPGTVAGLPARESVRGWLYSLAREATLTQLRQRGWLDSLPPTDEPGPAGLADDIWRGARAMPAFYRAVLIVEELHALSPTEKARALGVQRTDLARLVDEARRAFTRQFDALARAEGRPTSAQIDTDRIIGLRQRVTSPDATLFSYLPILVLPDSLEAVLRQRVVQAMSGQPLRPIEPPVIEPPPPPPPQPVAMVVEPPPEPESTVVTTTTTTRPGLFGFGGEGLPTAAIAALAGISLAVVICGLVYLFLLRNTEKPVVQSTQPANGAVITQGDAITVGVNITGQRGVDPTRSKLVINGQDVSPYSRATQNSLSWTGALGPGQYNVSATVFDTAGQQTESSWAFTVIPGTPTLTPTFMATVIVFTTTPLPTATPLPTSTPLPTATPLPTQPSLPTATPTITPIPPSVTPAPPSPTPCLVGIFGKVFNDINANQALDPGEPTLSGATIYLQNFNGQNLSLALSDAFGTYQFANLPFGQYRVAIATPAGWYATTPTIVTVPMFACGAFIVVDFGFNQTTPTPSPTSTPTITPIIIVVTVTNTPITPSVTPVTPSMTPTTPSATPITPSATPVTPSVTPITPSATPVTPSPTSPAGNIVTNISLTPAAPTYSGVPGKCPATLTVTGQVDANGPIQYHWERSNGTSTAIVLGNPSGGVVAVQDTFQTGAGPLTATLWDRLVLVVPTATPTLTPSPTPNQTLTPQPTPTPTGPDIVYFQVVCTQ
ncbi:MAG: SdrD B-like domain-containing protein [Anaerolineae bacterium]